MINRAAFLFLMRHMGIDDALYTNIYPKEVNQTTEWRSCFGHDRPCTTAESYVEANALEHSAAILIILY
jgi:hypothetical protein